jgi:hypothetical protein
MKTTATLSPSIQVSRFSHSDVLGFSGSRFQRFAFSTPENLENPEPREPEKNLKTENRRQGRGLIANVSAFDVPPPGDGEKTVTCALPAAATSLAGIEAISCVGLT